MLKSLYFYAILLIASGVIIYYKSEKPIIYSIPVIQAQKNLQIIGKKSHKLYDMDRYTNRNGFSRRNERQ
jgi:hypothetical protein